MLCTSLNGLNEIHQLNVSAIWRRKKMEKEEAKKRQRTGEHVTICEYVCCFCCHSMITVSSKILCKCIHLNERAFEAEMHFKCLRINANAFFCAFGARLSFAHSHQHENQCGIARQTNYNGNNTVEGNEKKLNVQTWSWCTRKRKSNDVSAHFGNGGQTMTIYFKYFSLDK